MNPVYRAVRRRYWSCSLTNRPADLDMLLTLRERLALIVADAWPITPEARSYITEPPRERRRRRASRLRKAEADLAELLATRADAIRAVLFNRGNRRAQV